MSQRNPLNDRYTSNEHHGVARKSAASAKPKSKAASSVIVKSAKKTPQEKKAAQKAERQKQRQKQAEIDRKYYKPDTERYRFLRRIWWALLIGAVVCTVLAWFFRDREPLWLSFVFLALAYVGIIAAFTLDLRGIRKERRRYQAEMMELEEKSKREERIARQKLAQSHVSKRKSTAPKSANSSGKAQPKKIATAADLKSTEEQQSGEQPKRKSLFGSGFRLSNREKMKAEEQAAKEAKASEDQ